MAVTAVPQDKSAPNCSARSIIAESIMNREGAAKFNAWSAGSIPTGKVNPHAIHLLEGLNYLLFHGRRRG